MMELRLEALVPEMEFGTVVRWLKQEGDPVEAGEVIVEVEAEKVVQEVSAPAGGTLREIVGVEGDELRVGSVLAIIEEV
jgi:pyruvate/2-oxoglutarate dehydrogenase complex dihydrolipoamide acyltransferase (E2) component